MKFSDRDGYLRLVICAFFLCCHHGIRDYFITALPLIASESYEDPNEVLRLNDVDFGNIAFFTYQFGDSNFTSNFSQSYNCSLQLKVEWTSEEVGLALSIIHWTWIIPLVLSPFVIHRIPKTWLLLVCLTSSCVVALFSDLAVNSGGSTGLIILRGVQGLFQGWCYPIVYYILQDLQCVSFAFPYFLIFLAPWLGSSLGMLMGGTGMPFLGCYIFSILGLSVALTSFYVPFESDSTSKLPNQVWKETVSSLCVWACVGVQMAGVWALHTFFIGMTLTTDFLFSRADLYWAVSITVLIGGVSTRFLAQAAMGLMRHHFLSALNRRRVVITLGNFLTLLSLIIIGTFGVNSTWGLFGLSLLGLCFGTSFCSVGVRLNLHDMGPTFPRPFLLLGAIGATIGAGLASLLFPIISNVKCDPTHQIPFLIAWMMPVAAIIVFGVAHLFLLSVNPLPHQIIIHQAKTKLGNGVTLSLQLPASRKDSDAKSFKSVKSALTYKTAVSRTRTRTISLRTVKEDDDDVYSFAGSDDYKSAYPDDDDLDMRSIKSSATFKSTFEESPEMREVIINVEDLDRTNEWLKTHHNAGKEVSQIIAEEKEKVERSFLLALQW